MIELNGYNVTAALIIGAGAIELYKQWKVGHDLAGEDKLTEIY